jgi:hypothetical protein
MRPSLKVIVDGRVLLKIPLWTLFLTEAVRSGHSPLRLNPDLPEVRIELHGTKQMWAILEKPEALNAPDFADD